MNLEFSPELLELLAREQNHAQLGSWILNNTKTGEHLMKVTDGWKSLPTAEKDVLFQDLRVIGSILPVLLKLRLLP